MASFSPTISIIVAFTALLSHNKIFTLGSNFTKDFDITWGGNGRAKIVDNGETVSLSLDKQSGSGFQSKNKYLFGNIHMQVKLVPGNSAGTITTFYLWSNGSRWDEIDFGFLGNLSGDTYVLHTNVVTQGMGNREQRFYIWFDPTEDFHTYSIYWNPQRIIFAVDGAPIRVFKNLESIGIPYPKNQTMRIYCSIWSADDRSTSGGGFIKTDWSNAPFNASFRNFDDIESCRLSFANNRTSTTSCDDDNDSSSQWLSEELDTAIKERVRWVQNNYMIYSYCSDVDRFPNGIPPECDLIY